MHARHKLLFTPHRHKARNAGRMVGARYDGLKGTGLDRVDIACRQVNIQQQHEEN